MANPSLLPAWLCVVLALPLARAGIQIITEHPSPFAAADPNDPRYVVAFYDSEAAAAAVWPHSSSEHTTTLTRPGGEQLTCRIPAKPRQEHAVVPLTAVATPSRINLPGGTVEVPGKSPFELLDLLTGRCLYHNDGQWTYEVCYKRHVRQFRQDAGASMEQFTCGQYEGDEQQDEAVLEDASAAGYPVRYVRHTFNRGANCLLTGAPRTAEVRYTCRQDARDDMVVSVKEFPTCNYIVMVTIPNLCRHAAFEPRPPDERLIACYPSVGSKSAAGLLAGNLATDATSARQRSFQADGSLTASSGALAGVAPGAEAAAVSSSSEGGPAVQPAQSTLEAINQLQRGQLLGATLAAEVEQQRQQQQRQSEASGSLGMQDSAPAGASAAAAAAGQGGNPAAEVKSLLTQRALQVVNDMVSRGDREAGAPHGVGQQAELGSAQQQQQQQGAHPAAGDQDHERKDEL